MTRDTFIEVYDGSGNVSVTLEGGDLQSVDFTRIHSGVSNWKAQVPYQPSLENDVFNPIQIWHDHQDSTTTTLLFDGRLENVKTSDDQGQTTISGRGAGWELENNSASVTYTNILAHDAIIDYVNNHTSHSINLTTPTPKVTVSQKDAQNYSSSGMIDNFSIANNEPIFEGSDGTGTFVGMSQVTWHQECENFDNLGADTETATDASNGEYVNIDAIGDSLSFDFSTEHVIADGDVRTFARIKRPNSDSSPGVNLRVDGDVVDNIPEDLPSTDWKYRDNRNGNYSGDLSAGTHTFKIDVSTVGSGAEMWFDVAGVYDKQYKSEITFDNTVHTTDGYLDGPEYYRSSHQIQSGQTDVPWNVTFGYLDLNSDLSGTPDPMQMRLDSQTWRPTDGSPQSEDYQEADFDANNERGTTLEGRATLQRDDSTSQSATPRFGWRADKVYSWKLQYDGNDIGKIQDKTFDGTHLQNLIKMHNIAGMRFYVAHDDNAGITIESFRPDDRSTLSEPAKYFTRRRQFKGKGYANHVTVRGATQSGSRIIKTAQADSEVSTWGKQHYDLTDPSLTTSVDVASRARTLLSDKVVKAETRGKVGFAPEGSKPPGRNYNITFADTNTLTIPVEEVRYREQADRLTGTLKFTLDQAISGNMSGLEGKTQRNTDAL